MPLINLSVRHGQSLQEAQSRLQTAVNKVMNQFGALVRQVAWSTDHSRVRLDGRGFWLGCGWMPRTSTPQAISPSRSAVRQPYCGGA